jgi:N-acyl-phosphatidylethanolamine-hydrolysing phospholipase D
MKRLIDNAIIEIILIVGISGCNMFYVSVRNIPVFFSSPAEVHNKITSPIRKDVRLSALWIGHSTVLIQMDDKVIITDPFLTETVGEMARRVIEPGIDPENIPCCDLILVSHSHFDHLSYGSLQLLEKKNSRTDIRVCRTAIVFPEGVEWHLPDMDFEFVKMKNNNGYESKVIGAEKIINGIKVTAVFAQHWGGRYGLDGYVWGDNGYTGYILEYNGMTVYFAGDTGYDSLKFKQLGRKFKIDLALIPIGPCAGCTQFGTRNHVFPSDALEIFKDLDAGQMIPIHYGTLVFAQADPMDPALFLQAALIGSPLKEKITILKIGEQRIYM